MFNKKYLITTLLVIIGICLFPFSHVLANVSDGTYEITYEMKERSSENTSIADGYFTKPAILSVEDGELTIELTVTGADMIKSLGAPSGPVEILEEDQENDERTVRFDVEDLSEPIPLKMHVVVPDLYDTEHEARAAFDLESLKEISTKDEQEDQTEENPKTSDQTPILTYVSLFLVSIILIIYTRKKIKT